MRPDALIAAGILLLFPIASQAVEEIKPPFKLTWGETTARLERLLQGAKTKIIERRMVEGREAWDVEGIVQPGLRRTVFYFRQGELVEVELQYQKEEWDQAKYDQYMGEMRRSIEAKYGQGQLIARKTEVIGDVTQTVVGYKWNQNNTALELFFYSAQNVQDAAQTFRTLSVHYRSL
ncbi:MAG TPA: hypothetical protein VF614_01440 [Chthoniobacteraceae bacterium]|jgi:hypothetical protein